MLQVGFGFRVSGLGVAGLFSRIHGSEGLLSQAGPRKRQTTAYRECRMATLAIRRVERFLLEVSSFSLVGWVLQEFRV